MNPVLFDMGFIEIRWYSVFLLLAFGIGMFLVYREGKRMGIDREFLFNLSFWVIIFSLIGARVYYVLFNFEAKPEFIAELERVYRITDGILKFIVVRKEDYYIYQKI